MAVTKKKATTKLALRLEIGESASGKMQYSTRTISKITPTVQDEKLYSFATGLAGLVKYETNTVSRTDAAELVEA